MFATFAALGICFLAAAVDGPADLAGRWAVTTTPPISVQMPRGSRIARPIPMALELRAGRTRLSGTLSLWRGDVWREGPASGTFDGRSVVLTGGGFVLRGVYDRASGTVTGTVLELPGRSPPDGIPTRFRMERRAD